MWPEKAVALVGNGRSLNELAAVRPYIEKLILRWCEDSPKTPQPPETRRQFLAATEAKRPSWLLPGRGDLQMHTTWSDGEASILEMAKAAMERGHEYSAINRSHQGFEELMPQDVVEAVRDTLGGGRVWLLAKSPWVA